MTNQPLPPSRPLEQPKRAIVLGASSGIGAALVEALAAKGYAVAALARREARLIELQTRVNRIVDAQRVLIYTHNTTDYDAVPALFQQIVADLGGLDLIVYNAAVMPVVAPDEYDFEKDRHMMEVNTIGAMAWLNQAAVRFSREGKGHIVGVSSIAGDRGRRGNPGYHTSKGALTIYLESLRNRLSGLGIYVTTIKPGFVQTSMLDNATGALFWVITPEEAATQIIRAVERKRGVVYVPGRWVLVSLVIRHIPSFIFKRLPI